MGDLHLLSPRGFRAAGVYAGIKRQQRNDVGLLVCDRPATAAAAFTTNRVVAAPVIVGRRHLRGASLRAIVVNSGNANACTGPAGLRDARRMCVVAGSALGVPATAVLPSSTGIIGHALPMDRLERGIVEAAQQMGDSAEHAGSFADAMLTTDTRRKSAAVRLRLGGATATLAGICKGAGMIGPRMAPQATMLAYLTTDATLAPAALRRLFAPAVMRSFNAVTIDDHMSTNDTACILASGASGERIAGGPALRKFAAALDEVCQSLAVQIAADGEGATKVVRIDVSGCAHAGHAERIARAIAASPLVKCAMHGNDPNWGRIVSAAGMCGAPFRPESATLTLAGVPVYRSGRPTAFDAPALSRALANEEVRVALRCGRGPGSFTVWTCDLSRAYVEINADYHT